MPGSTVILLAAGSGRRMEGSVPDKALAPLGGLTAIGLSLRAFLAAGLNGPIIIVYRDDPQKIALETAVEPVAPDPEKILWVPGGSERQASVWNALRAAPIDSDYVYIHDVARPCIHQGAIAALQLAVERDGAAVLAHPVVDTIKRIPHAGRLRSTQLEDLDRSRLWAMETPQAFEIERIRAAYRHVLDQGLEITDDTAAAASIGLKTTLVPNPHPNPKLTTKDDLRSIECLLKDV
ncbi:MAG: NTP transferase domain-containing protein [Verrucomicrobia bacterium]|jgi:2-C-methyl-D-erythritol 4-phosphate cytidylyltransferase|nr:NTP transferase domain-containing protein [Verrucomicrobiota bacterium]